jgi:glycosyltransferase involved in cell wall biosynthesis
MQTDKGTKSCLVISYGPVPTPQHQTVEGGGMRAWGLAEGLRQNGIDVTVGVNSSFPLDISEHAGIRLVNWSQDEEFARLLNSFDAVLVSYTMGSDSVFIAEHLDDSVQLILDAYVPIYVEVSARESKDIDTEYRNYMADIVRFNRVLKRGDYFLCASEVQKTFYVGVLSSLGIINPRSYREDRILIAPFGIHDLPPKAVRNPYSELGIKNSDFVAMWFGGLYPWFRIQELLDAVLELSKNPKFKFVIVGGKNPFNPNPDFSKQYELALSFATKHKLLNKSMYFIDWVDFDDRVNYFVHADVVISLNQPGQENGFSWRTRVMDFVWGELAIVTNGGDPLSEDLIANNAAVRIPELSSKALVDSIVSLESNTGSLAAIHKAIRQIKPRYYWDNIMSPVAGIIETGHALYANEATYKKKMGVTSGLATDETSNTRQPGSLSRARNAAALPGKVIRHARRKGLRRSASLAVDIINTQAKKRLPTSQPRRFVFISHPIDNTGAPVVLLQMVEEFTQKYGASRVRLITPAVVSDSQNIFLRRLGIKVDKAAFGLGFRLLRLQLGLNRNDFVLMNTAAIYDNYRDFILLWLRTGRLKHAFWFIHEDPAQLPFIHKEFLDNQNIKQTHRLMESGKLTVLTPSKRTRNEYAEMLNSENVHPVNLHVEVDKGLIRNREASEYSELDFLLSGTPSDGRKGQVLALSAFYCFVKKYRDNNPNNYRNFRLHLVAIGDDYLSQQIKWISESLMPDVVTLYPSLPKDEALKVSARCNAVICCSLNETFGLYIAEGMFMGHVVVRNNSSGVDEQLKDGVNGYFVDHTDIEEFASVLEKLLNKKTTSDSDLQKMGRASQDIINTYSQYSYIDQIEKFDN